MTRDRVIGRDGQLPWDLPADRRLFRRLTLGNTVIMGRLTFASLAGALPERHNLVVSRTCRQLPGATVCPDFTAALAVGRQLGRPLFVIGGVELYRRALALAGTVHVSWVEGSYPGDRRFPPFPVDTWQPVAITGYPGFEYVIYQRQPLVTSNHPPIPSPRR
jgi:dihydrofolate reductase